MISRPPLYTFQPFEPSRVAEVRAARETAWAIALNPPSKKSRKSSTPKTPAHIPGVPADQQAMVRQALKNLGL